MAVAPESWYTASYHGYIMLSDSVAMFLVSLVGDTEYGERSVGKPMFVGLLHHLTDVLVASRHVQVI